MYMVDIKYCEFVGGSPFKYRHTSEGFVTDVKMHGWKCFAPGHWPEGSKPRHSGEWESFFSANSKTEVKGYNEAYSVSGSFTVEELYQAFKSRMVAETKEKTK